MSIPVGSEYVGSVLVAIPLLNKSIIIWNNEVISESIVLSLTTG